MRNTLRTVTEAVVSADSKCRITAISSMLGAGTLSTSIAASNYSIRSRRFCTLVASTSTRLSLGTSESGSAAVPTVRAGQNSPLSVFRAPTTVSSSSTKVTDRRASG